MSDRVSISKKLRFEVFKRDGFTCQYCGRMAPDVILEVDHITPVAKGGTTELLNLVTSCRDCNRGKGKTLLSSHDELKKQQQELKDLNERREQLEFLIKWKNELSNFEEQQVEAVCSYFEKKVQGCSITDTGKNKVRKWVKQFGVTEVISAIDIAYDKYYNPTRDETINFAWNMIGRICATQQMATANPEMKAINVLVKSADYQLNFCPKKTLRSFLISHYTPKDNPYIRKILYSTRYWSEFREELANYYNVDEGELYGNN